MNTLQEIQVSSFLVVCSDPPPNTLIYWTYFTLHTFDFIKSNVLEEKKGFAFKEWHKETEVRTNIKLSSNVQKQIQKNKNSQSISARSNLTAKILTSCHGLTVPCPFFSLSRPLLPFSWSCLYRRPRWRQGLSLVVLIPLLNLVELWPVLGFWSLVFFCSTVDPCTKPNPSSAIIHYICSDPAAWKNHISASINNLVSFVSLWPFLHSSLISQLW